jgi:hypothetical protein
MEASVLCFLELGYDIRGNKPTPFIFMLTALIRSIGYPFASFNQSRRSTIQRTQFYEGLVDPCTTLVDLVHSCMHPVYAFSYRKIIHLIQKIPGPRYFYKNTPKLFQKYILVSIILHLGP